MAAVGTLTIEMAANVARLSQDMQKATKTVDGAMSKIQRSVDVAKTAIVGLAGVLTIRQFSSFIKSSAAASEQLERMAFLANTSVADFQRMSLASNKFGISQEKLGDILKDTQDKVGDFMQTGGGAMADFFENIAPKVGVTADQFRKLNGRDALQLYVSSLEKANLSQSDMVFYMEAIASDSTLLLPLLRENGKAFEEIAIQAEKFGAVMDEQTIAASKDLNANLHSMNNFMDGIGISIYSALLPGLNALSDSFIKFAESSRIAQHAASAILILFQTLAVVGSDVIFVIDQVVKGLVALVEAQYKLLSGNFSGAIKVFEDYNAQARDARTALDELQAEIMGLGKESDKAEKPVSGLSNSFVSGAKAATELEKAYEALVKTLRSDITKSTAELQAEQQGLNTAQTDFLKLVSGDDWKQYTAAQKMLITDLFKQRIETEQLIDLEKKRAKAAEDRLKKMLDDEKDFREELKKEDEKLAAEKLKKEEEFFAQQRKQIQEIEDQLTDALMRAFESGKGFGQAFKDTLINMFRTMVLRPILAPISGAFAGAFGTSGAMAAGAGGMGAGSGFLAGMGAAASSLGVGIAAGFSNALSLNFAGSLTAAGQLIGTGAMSGISAGIGMAAGTLLPIVGIIAALPSISRALFGGGTRTTAQGITGTFTTGGANVVGFQDTRRSGGLLRRGSSGTNFSAVAMETQMFLDQSLIAITEKTRDFARLLSLNADAIEGVNQQVRINLMGLSAEQQQQAIANALNSFGDRLAEELLGTFEEVERDLSFGRTTTDRLWIAGPFVRAGETAGEALTRLAISLSTVNQIFDALNTTLYESSLVGADASSQLLELFGGIESFVNATTAYYEAFYREAERTSILTRQLTFSFGQLGLALPETRDAFRKVVEAQDLTTESGRAMFAALIQLSPAFASITKSAEETFVVLQQDTDRAFASLQRAIDAQRRSIQLSREVATEQLNALESVFDVLTSGIENLIGQGMSAASGRAFIDQAIATARATGYLPDANDLQRAINAAIGGTGSSGYASAFEMNRDRALLASRLTTLRDLTDDQLTEVERQVQLLEDQLTALDDQLSVAQKQLEALRGIDNSILSLADAMALFASVLGREQTAALTSTARSYSGGVVIGSAGASSGIAATEARTPIQEALFDVYKQVLGRAPDVGGLDFYSTSGKSIEQIIAEVKDSPEAQIRETQGVDAQNEFNRLVNEQLGLNTNITARAAGGFSRGLTLVGENGPELVNFSDPAMVYSASQSRSMMADTSVSQELVNLRQENKAQMRALVSLQGRMTRLLERWDGDGLPEERYEA